MYHCSQRDGIPQAHPFLQGTDTAWGVLRSVMAPQTAPFLFAVSEIPVVIQLVYYLLYLALRSLFTKYYIAYLPALIYIKISKNFKRKI